MKKIKLLPIILLFCLLLSSLGLPALALEEPELSSSYAVLMDADSGRIFYQKDADAKAYPASLTKVMTVLVAVEAVERGEFSLTDSVTASDTCLEGMVDDGSTAGIVPGETMPLQDLLYCALLASANEACNVIAEYIGGSVDAFVEMMNTRAEELGCTGTHFANTHGLPDENHYTTAHDIALIYLEAISHDLFAEISGTVSYSVAPTNVSDVRELSNTNSLINQNATFYPGYYYEYAKDICENYRMDLRRYKLIRERKQYIGVSNREAYQAMCEDLAFAQQSLKTVLNDYADLFRKRFSEGLSIRKAADAMQQNRGVIERRQAALYRAFAQLLQQRDEADGVYRLMQKTEYDQRDIEDLLE